MLLVLMIMGMLLLAVLDRYISRLKIVQGVVMEKHIEKSCHARLSSSGVAQNQESQKFFLTLKNVTATGIENQTLEIDGKLYNEAIVGKSLKLLYQYGGLTNKLYKSQIIPAN